MFSSSGVFLVSCWAVLVTSCEKLLPIDIDETIGKSGKRLKRGGTTTLLSIVVVVVVVQSI